MTADPQPIRGLRGQMAEERAVDYWRLVIRQALADCSTVDFHNLSDVAIDNIALVAAQAVHRELGHD